MARLFYLTHPQVTVDPNTPVPKWGLSDVGRERAKLVSQATWLGTVTRIVSSEEVKAVETAQILAAALGVAPELRSNLHENDRSSTGFVPPAEFEQLADSFFARPDESNLGWERAVDAQLRVVAGTADLLSGHTEDVVVVGHGGVGTLLYCHLEGLAIDRRHDQSGQGHYFTVDIETGVALHPWRPFEEAPPD